MGNFSVFGLLAMLLLPLAIAQSPANSSLEDLPACAHNCLETVISNSSCPLTDQTCICTDAPLQDQMTICVAANCGALDGFRSKNVTDRACAIPASDKSQPFITTSTTLAITAALFVVLRFDFKIFIAKSRIELDDWFILVTALLGTASAVVNVYGTAANGLGRDIWTLPPDNTTAFLRFYLASELLYYTEVCLLKLSLLLFYMRIFPGKGVRMVLLGTVALDALYGGVFVVVAIFQCHPVDYFWTNWDGLHVGTCLDMQAIAWSNASISIALDIWMLAIPLYQIRGLRLHWKKKVGVVMMFGVGAFVTVVSILRLQSLVAFADSTNSTMDHLDVANWSDIEINVGIICACMPCLRLVLVRFFPVLMGSTAQQYATHGNSRGTPGSRKGPESWVGKAPRLRPGSSSSVLSAKTSAVKNGSSFYEHDDSSFVQLPELDFMSPKGRNSLGALTV